jgi:hypothetical protein
LQWLGKTAENSYLPNEFRFSPPGKTLAASGGFLLAEGELCTPEGRRFI